VNPTTSAAPAIVQSTARTLVSAVLGWLAGKGYLTTDQVTQLVPYAGVIATALWGAYAHWKHAQDLKAAIAAPAGKATP